ncbi:MAG: GspE/PulE family protein [bacterium]|nr:GspE/PulE family protein [bacterium]
MLEPATLQQLLVDQGVVDAQEFARALKYAEKDGSLEDVLVDLGIIEEVILGQRIADAYGVPFANLREKRLDRELVRRLPETLARAQKLVLYAMEKDIPALAMNDPSNLETVQAIEKHLGTSVAVRYAPARAIAEAQRAYQRGIHEEFAQLLSEHVSAVDGKKAEVTAEDLPVVRLVDTLFTYAYQARASDIHLEPMESEVAVRFRVDGMLRDVTTLEPRVYTLVITRIKVLARLRTDEHFAAQDGQLSFETTEEKVDVRVSIIPTIYGEKVVLRLLAQKLRSYTIETLGFRPADLQKVREAFLRPYGMILATGPTGSGKTTTLYAILKTLNTREVNITTIEDPVEYRIEGVNQIQVNPRTELTFARGLRSIVRQDPDVIMVGEIRDAETAAIALNAALTGHLVLSTLHTNDAATAIPRLLDLGVEPFLAASSVNVVAAQRLVRRICDQCKIGVPLSEAQRETLRRLLHQRSKLAERFVKETPVAVGKGCSACDGSGYRGRVGIYEILAVNDDLRPLIVRKASAAEIKAVAIENGMTTMLEDGIEKVLGGITTIEEILSAAQE